LLHRNLDFRRRPIFSYSETASWRSVMKTTFDATRRSFLASTGALTAAGALGSLITPAAADTTPAHAHSAAMEGAATGDGAVDSARAPSIVRDPTDLPKPLPRRAPATVRIDLTTIEVEGRLADGAAYRYWTFNGKVPGPFARVRVGDTVEVNLTNDENSWMTHNVDFHAVLGEHGGGGLSLAEPGETKSFAFKAVKPGLFVYHCATPMVAQHIASGMYGMILVEPEEGLPPVDREFYVMQGEIYTEEPFGTAGLLTESYDKLMAERPEYFVFNGAVGALTDEHPLKAKVGETVRIFFGVGGPNFTSSFHVIGGIMDAVYPSGSLEDKPQRGIQTISVNPGSAVIADLTMMVPGHFVLVDHALTRAERGLKGILMVEGPENPEIFRALSGPSLSSVPSATTAA
jgi:nitrite reductase (NO-forming)